MSGLRPRPEVPAGVREAIRLAVDQVVAAAAPAPTTSAWRLSGRWFSAHPVRNRRRPG